MNQHWEEFCGKHYQRVLNSRAVWYGNCSRRENANIYYCKEDHGLYYLNTGKMVPLYKCYSITEAI